MAQFAIIRMQKFQVSDVQGIQKHNQRQGISKSNLDIDYEKTDQNYDLLNDENLKYESEIKEKISEQVKRKPRANSVVLSEFLITASPEYMDSLSAEEQKKYFEKSLEFIQERYGQKNTLYAVVHQDEATPHMHVGVIPITEDNRLSAKDIFNKQELIELQEEFPKHLQENNFEVVRGEKGSEKKHLSSQEYKEKQDLEKEIKEIEKEKEELTNDLTTFKEPKKVLEKIEKSMRKSRMGLGKDIVLPPEDYERLKKLSKSGIREKQNLYNYKKNTSEKIGDLEKDGKLAAQKIEKLEGKNEKLEKEVAGLQEHRKNEIIFKSMLQDDNRDLNISQTEINGRIILFNLENGHEPKNREQGESWTLTLEENKRLKTIPQSRLQRGLDKLKQFIDKLLGRGFSMDSILHRVQQEKSEKPKSKKKSHDMGL
ncbi:MobV family relaxase [Sporosarcina sp. FSL K6-5500]|uniref:MobV family relaxase n=1 Tax=Sporosarcina sp. FSL K6-5500 TaxID=2921558 RepID=UPI0030F864B2